MRSNTIKYAQKQSYAWNKIHVSASRNSGTTQKRQAAGKPRSGTVSKLADREPERQMQKQIRKSYFGEIEANVPTYNASTMRQDLWNLYQNDASMNMWQMFMTSCLTLTLILYVAFEFRINGLIWLSPKDWVHPTNLTTWWHMLVGTIYTQIFCRKNMLVKQYQITIFYRWYNRNHSQSWVVYDIVLPTLLEFSLFQGDPEVC